MSSVAVTHVAPIPAFAPHFETAPLSPYPTPWPPRLDAARAVVRAASGVLLFGAVAVLVGLAVSLVMRGA